MTIKVYLSAACESPAETHEHTGTIAEWFSSNGWSYTLAELPKSHITVNGEPLPMTEWATRNISHSDNVELRLLQHGGVFKGLGSLLGGIFGFVFGWLLPSNKRGRDYNAPAQGRRLEAASARANTAKLNEVVPETAGTFRRYPDYLNGPRRYFQNRREQMLEFLSCVGPGYYSIDLNSVKIADTPLNSLGDDASFQIFEPNADLSGISTHENWYTAPEVGGTSSGTAGLELSTELANRENVQPVGGYDFDGLEISRTDGEFPRGWGNGSLVRVALPLEYEVTIMGSGSSVKNVFTGYFGHLSLEGENTSGIFQGLSIEVVEPLVDGVGSLAFYSLVGNPPTISFLRDQPTGTRTYSFGDLQDRQIQTYDDTAISMDNFPFPQTSSADATVTFQGGVVYGEWSSDFVAAPGNELTDTLEVDFFFTGGLAYINDDGSLLNRSVGIEIQYRDASGGAATSVTRNYTDRTLDQIGFTERLHIPKMRPVVRVRRIGASSTSTQVHDTVNWYGLKCRLPTVTRYPRWTTLSTRIRSGGRIAAQSENQLNLVATRKLNVLLPNGEWSTDLQPTNDISAWVYHVAKSIGYSNENLNMTELQRLHDLWKQRGDGYSYVVELTTVKDAINAAFSAGMAAMSVRDGEITPVREGVRTQFEQSYSPQNFSRPLRRQFRGHRHSDNDGAEVEYYDAETWESKTVICKLPDSQGFKLEKVKLDFALTKTQAWRIGMRIAREQRYSRWDYDFSTEMDALNSSFGGYIGLFDNLAGRGQSAKIRSVRKVGGMVEITSTEKLDWQDGQTHIFAYRKPDGRFAGPWEAVKVNEYSLLVDMPEPLPVVSLKLDLPDMYFGVADKFAMPALITGIKPSGTNSVSVKAKNYDARIYADDDNFPEWG